MPQGTFIDVLRRHAFKSHADPLSDDGLDEALYGIEPLRILVSPLAGDNQRLAARHIHDRLAGRLGVSVSIADRPLTVPAPIITSHFRLYGDRVRQKVAAARKR